MDSKRLVGAIILSGMVALFIRQYSIQYIDSYTWYYKYLIRLTQVAWWKLTIGFFFLFLLPEQIIGIIVGIISKVWGWLQKIGIVILEYFGTYYSKYKNFKMATSGYLTGWKKLKHLNRWNKGLRLSNVAITLKQTFISTIVWGGSGSGKTASVLANWLLSLVGSAVVTDPANQLAQWTGGYQQKVQGKKVMIFNPERPNISAYFNPIAYVNKMEDGADKLSSLIIDHKYGGDAGGDNAFFHSGGKKIMKACIQACANIYGTHPQYATLAQAYEFMNLLQIDRPKTMAFICSLLINQPRIKNEFKATMGGKNEKTVDSFLADAQNALSFYVNEQIARVTSENTINFEAMRKEATVLYIQISETRMKYYAPLLNIFYSFFFDEVLSCTEEEAKQLQPLHFILEEVSALGKLENLGVFLNQARKYRSSCTIVGQSVVSQLNEVYEKDGARTILNSVNNHVIFGSLDTDSCEYLSREMGKYKNPEGEKVWRMDSHEIKDIPKYHAVLFSKNKKKPIKVGQLSKYDDSRQLKKRAKYGAPTLEIREELPPLQFITLSDMPDTKQNNSDEHKNKLEEHKKTNQRENPETPPLSTDDHERGEPS